MGPCGKFGYRLQVTKADDVEVWIMQIVAGSLLYEDNYLLNTVLGWSNSLELAQQ